MIALPIETERLIIRPLRLDDADEMGESREWIAEKIARAERDDGMSLWAVVERASGRAVGLAGFQWEEIEGRRELDLGCVMGRDWQGLGYGTEASQALIEAAFAAGYERLTGLTLPDNAPAQHVLEKLGFDREGETRFDGRPYAYFVRSSSARQARSPSRQ